MTFEKWINVFTLKNHFDFKFDGLQKTFEKILEKNNADDKYFSRLVFYLYNYKKYFENKKGRNRKKKEENKDKNENNKNENEEAEKWEKIIEKEKKNIEKIVLIWKKLILCR